MRLCLLGFFLLVLCTSNAKKTVKITNGVEFKDISRAALLKLLSSFDEQLTAKARRQKQHPVFVAEFANNEYTNRFIYPETIKKINHSYRMTTNDSNHSSTHPIFLASRTETASTLQTFSVVNLQPDPPFWTKTALLQLGYGIWANMTLIGVGMTFGFTSVAVPQLRKPDSSVVLTTNEETMITSVLTLSAPVGCMISGIVIDKCGRRFSLILCQLPIALGWFYIGLATCAKDIIVGRIITGVGIGLCMATPRTYTTEITLPNMRGVIGALPNVANSVGITAQAILGSYLKWHIICYLCGSYTVLVTFWNCFLPESPFYVILKSTASEAGRVLAKFRSKNYDLQAEIDDLHDFKRVNNIRGLTAIETILALFTPSSCKPICIVMTYMMLSQLVGITVVIMWAVEILENSKSSINPNLGNVFLGISRMVFALFSSFLMYKIGRRPMALISAIGLGLVCLGLFTLLSSYERKSVFPQIFLTAYIGFASLGYNTLPFLIMSEVLPLQIRGLASGLILSSVMLLMFGSNQIYPMLSRNLGLKNTFLFYGVTSLLGAILLYFILPETKNLTLQEIEEYYNAHRPTLVSQREVRALQLREMSRIPGMSKLNLAEESKHTKKKLPKHLSVEKLNKRKWSNPELRERMKEGSGESDSEKAKRTSPKIKSDNEGSKSDDANSSSESEKDKGGSKPKPSEGFTFKDSN